MLTPLLTDFVELTKGICALKLSLIGLHPEYSSEAER
jgi:hypothetical protein